MEHDSQGQVKALFILYKEKVDRQLKLRLRGMKGEEELQKACAYALLGSGKRYRPAIVYMLADALNPGCDVTLAALTVEMLHAATLVADDLPCMDDDDERRDRPSLHKVFGEATAVLVSYCLISEGWRCLVEQCRHLQLSAEAVETCLLNVADNTGICGASGGQYLDLYRKEFDLPNLKEMLFKKTGAIFEVTFVLGWICGGGSIREVPLVKKLAYDFGLAFQIADDLGDIGQDGLHFSNIAHLLGPQKAMEEFLSHFHSMQNTYAQLALSSPALDQIWQALLARAKAHLDHAPRILPDSIAHL